MDEYHAEDFGPTVGKKRFGKPQRHCFSCNTLLDNHTFLMAEDQNPASGWAQTSLYKHSGAEVSLNKSKNWELLDDPNITVLAQGGRVRANEILETDANGERKWKGIAPGNSRKKGSKEDRKLQRQVRAKQTTNQDHRMRNTASEPKKRSGTQEESSSGSSEDESSGEREMWLKSTSFTQRQRSLKVCTVCRENHFRWLNGYGPQPAYAKKHDNERDLKDQVSNVEFYK